MKIICYIFLILMYMEKNFSVKYVIDILIVLMLCDVIKESVWEKCNENFLVGFILKFNLYLIN